MESAIAASVFFAIRHLPAEHSDTWTKWACNTNVQFKLSEEAAGIVLLVERKRPSTARQLQRAVREMCARSGCKLPELGDDWVEALDATQFQAALQPAMHVTDGSQPPLEPQMKRACALEALEGGETVFCLPGDFDRRARERYIELQMRA